MKNKSNKIKVIKRFYDAQTSVKNNPLAIIRKIVRHQKLTIYSAYFFIGLLILQIINKSYHQYKYDVSSILFLITLIIFGGNAVYALKILPAEVKGSDIVLDALKDSDDVCDIGDFIDALSIIDSNPPQNIYHQSFKQVAILAVTRLLRKMRREDAALVNAKQRAQLYNALLPSEWNLGQREAYDIDFALHIVAALEVIGMRDSLPPLHRLTQSTTAPADLRAAARKCLAVLEERFSSEETHETLLRASVPASAPGELLRPVSGVDQAAAEESGQLLTPAIGLHEAVPTQQPAFLLQGQTELKEKEQQPNQNLQLEHGQDQSHSEYQ